MKIIFNAHGVGFGNNGGTRTLIRCAETLSELGHEVIMCSNYKNNYTWHKPNGIKFEVESKVPSCDLCIATGYRSVLSTIKSKSHKKIYYVRGFETWVASKSHLIKSYKKLHCIVNSEWLLRMMKKNQIRSDLIYPGLDFEWYKQKNNSMRMGVGSLFHKRHKTKRHLDAISAYPKISLLNRDIKNASPQVLQNWYNSLKIWFAPSELEGLHNPPMESSLCGCALVCTDHPKSGMQDYAIHGETALVYPARNLNVAKKYIYQLLKDESYRMLLVKNMNIKLKDKIGTRKNNMIKFLDIVKRI